jgi:hypothetical protein
MSPKRPPWNVGSIISFSGLGSARHGPNISVSGFIESGACAIGISTDAIELRQSYPIEELALRCLGQVQEGRVDLAARKKRAMVRKGVGI